MGGNLEGISDETDRSRIEDDVVVVLLQQVDHLTEVVAGQQLRGVGRYGTGQQQVEVVVGTRLHNLLVEVGLGDLVLRQQRRDTQTLVGHAEEAAQGRLTDVQATENDLLAQQGEARAEVGCAEGLTLTRRTGGEEDHLLAALQHELDVRTQRTEDLVHLGVLVLMDHDTGRGLHGVTGHGHIGNDGQVGVTCHILATLNLITEEVEDEDDGKRDGEGQEQGTDEDDETLRTHLTLIERLVDELTLVGSGCQGDAVLLTLLQEQEIHARLHVLLTANLVEHTLLDGCGGDTALVFAELRGDALTVDVGRAAGLQQGGLDARLQTLDGLGERLYLGRRLTGSRQQTVTILHSLVVAGDELGGGPVGQTDVGGDNLILILRIVDVFTQIVEHLDLGVGLGEACRELVRHLHGLGRIDGETSHGVLTLETLNLTLGRTQLLVDLLHAFVDELLGAQGYLVLVGIGLVVVAFGQTAEEVHTALDVLVGQRHLGDISQLGGGRDGHCLQILGSHDHRRHNLDKVGLARLQLETG